MLKRSRLALLILSAASLLDIGVAAAPKALHHTIFVSSGQVIEIDLKGHSPDGKQLVTTVLNKPAKGALFACPCICRLS